MTTTTIFRPHLAGAGSRDLLVRRLVRRQLNHVLFVRGLEKTPNEGHERRTPLPCLCHPSAYRVRRCVSWCHGGSRQVPFRQERLLVVAAGPEQHNAAARAMPCRTAHAAPPPPPPLRSPRSPDRTAWAAALGPLAPLHSSAASAGVCGGGGGGHQGQTSREGERDMWWTVGTTRGGAGHLGLTHTETQRGRLRTACGQRCVDSKHSQTTPATTSTSSIRQLLGAADAQTTPARAPAAAADRK